MPLCDTPPSLQVASLVAVGGGALGLAWFLRRRSGRLALPGPCSLPFVGNLIQFMSNKDTIPQLFNRWADKYGPIYIVSIGGIDAVVINTMDLIREGFGVKAMVYSDRPSCLPLIQKVYQGRGMVFQNGDQWKELRKCVIPALTEWGVANESIESRVLHEIQKLLFELSKLEEGGYAVDPSCLYHEAVTNIMCSIFFGCRYKYGSKRMQKLVQMIRLNLSYCNIFHSANIFQFLSSPCNQDFSTMPCHETSKQEVPKANCAKAKEQLMSATENAKCILSFIHDEIEKHKEDFNPNNVRDFIDEYLHSTLGGRSKKKNICRQNVEATIMDMFTFGTSPISTVLRWATLCLLEYPDVAEKCHEEIDRVIGCGRPPEFCDLECLPYVRATLLEVNRRFTIMPLGIPHFTKCDTALCDTDIPAKTVIICNHHAIHMNAHYWTDPCKFCPERFLDDTCCALRVQHHDAYIPYGTGPRYCCGHELATNISSVLFATLLQRFDFYKTCECDDYSCYFRGDYDVTYEPMQFQMKLRVH